MIILIDGYNLLKQLHGPTISDMQRSAFANLLGRYIKKRNHKITLVFDGGPYLYPTFEKQKGITLWYSGPKDEADDLIIFFVKENSSKEILVVSSDRELCNQVKEHQAQIIEPSIFYQKVQDVCTPLVPVDYKSSAGLYKLIDEEDAEVDALMFEAAGMKVPFKDESAVQKGKITTGQELSKKDRSYKKLIDKL